VADYGLGLPDRFKAGAFGPPKRVLRRLVRRRLGPEISEAKKQGFSIPVHRWLRGPMREVAEELLSEARIEALGVLRADTVARARDDHMQGRAQLGFELWGLMVLSEWYRLRVQAPPSGSDGELERREFPLHERAPS
jgi:asparagine synthase (glutamine-hydrolysing)